jgi:integrase/recombinase XerD
MARKRGPKPKAEPDRQDPHSLRGLLGPFLEWMKTRHFAEDTIRHRRQGLEKFIAYCEERSVFRPNEVHLAVLESYQRHLFYYRKRDGRPLTLRTQTTELFHMRAFFKWLARHRVILYDPTTALELPRPEKRIPRQVLTASEAEAVLNQAQPRTTIGLRDRAILETLYSTGIRRAELCNLSVYDLDTARETVLIRLGKGKKDRMVPIGERALHWIDRYIQDGRPELLVDAKIDHLFLTERGGPLSRKHLTRIVHEYTAQAAPHKPGACHLLRHTMATLMLEHGADVRYIQEMLGHADMNTTQIYTRVSIQKLKQIHTQTHPGALLKPRGQHAPTTADAAALAQKLLKTLDGHDQELDSEDLGDAGDDALDPEDLGL